MRGNASSPRPATASARERPRSRSSWAASLDIGRHEVRARDRVVDLAAHRLQQDRVGLDPFTVDRLGEVVERAHQQVDRARVVALAEEQVRRPPSPDLGAGRVVELVGVDRAQQLLDLVGLPLPEAQLGDELHDLGRAIAFRRLSEDALGHRLVTLDERETRGLREQAHVDVPATFEAPRDDADTITTTARAVHGQGVGQRAADPAASDRGQLQVDHLGEERMRQRDLDALRALRHHEEATSLERLEHGGAGDLLEEVEPELPRDCEQLDDIALVLLQTSEPFLDEELERRRRVHERLREVPHPVALDEVAGVTRRLDELAQHSRVAGRRVDELLEAVLRDRRTEARGGAALRRCRVRAESARAGGGGCR